MSKLFLRDIGSHPERDLEVTLFPDGELQFEADNGKYVHINIARAGVKQLFDFLLREIHFCTCGNFKPGVMVDGIFCMNCGMPQPIEVLACEEEGCNERAVMFYCETHAP